MSDFTFTVEDNVGLFEFSRPDVLNALNSKLMNEAVDFIHNQLLNEHVKVLIVTGAGDRAFAAGADIKEMLGQDDRHALEYFALGQKLARAFEMAPVVTIAAINGYALGGGLEMALGCDFIYAAPSAKLGLPEVSLGLIPGFGGITRLAETIGMRKAKELIFTGRYIWAEEAYNLGIVNRVCEGPVEEAKQTAREILKNDFFAVMQAKQALDYHGLATRDQSLEYEKNCCALCHGNDEAQDLMKRFVEK